MGRNFIGVRVKKRNMAHKQSFGLPHVVLLLASLGASLAGSAMTPVLRSQDADSSPGVRSSRLAGDWRSADTVTLPGSKPPQSPSDPSSNPYRSPAPANARLDRMILLLAPSPARQNALQTLLAAQLNPASPEYHKWLTPSAFADAFSNSPADVAAIA